MSTFFVYEIVPERELQILRRSPNTLVGRLPEWLGNALFYCESSERGGVCFGGETRNSLIWLLERCDETAERTPVILFLSSVGANLAEATKALDDYAAVFSAFVRAKPRVFSISVIAGNCVGGSAYLSALCDVALFSEDRANLCLTGPRIVQAMLGVYCEKEDLGGFETQSQSGNIAASFRGPEACADILATFLSMAQKKSVAVRAPMNALTERDSIFNNQPYDMRRIIKGIIDDSSDLELYSYFGTSLLTYLARLNGHPIGVLANQPLCRFGAIDTGASEKGARFLELCAVLQLPLLVLEDTPSFYPGLEQERAGIQWRGATFLRKMIMLDTPKITLILHKSFGGAYIAMNSICLGADSVYAWPKAEIGIMGAKAERSLHNELDDERSHMYETRLTAEANQFAGSVTEVISPEQTRKTLIRAFEEKDERRKYLLD